ncbi:MAG: hypothetical protein V4787_02325 [Pseudomonadota bacterium]
MTSSQRLIDAFAAAGGKRTFKALGASGQIGYGIPTKSLDAGIAREPDLIGCDGGSIDHGPYYLGSGNMATAVSATKRDIRKMIHGARKLDVPLVIGSAGSAGAQPHLDRVLGLVREIAREDDLKFSLGTLRADIPKDVVKKGLAAGAVEGFEGMVPLTNEAVDSAVHIVAQMGMSSFRRAFEAGVDVLIAGRACDTAIFSTLPVMLGFPEGLSIHMAKIIECASLCCLPGGRDPILATLDQDGFMLESMADFRRATPTSVAAHSLYEQSDPFTIYEPAGHADLQHAKYTAVNDRVTRVSGAKWIPAEYPTIKLEGATKVGYHCAVLCASADPRFIANHEDILTKVAQTVKELTCEFTPQDYTLNWRVYGVNGVHGLAANVEGVREIFMLIECTAPTDERAGEVARSMKQYLMHFGYPGRLSTGGNLAFPFTPPEASLGEVFRFNVYHLMRHADIESLFPLEIERL